MAPPTAPLMVGSNSRIGREAEINQQDRQSEQVIELVAGQLFLIGHRGPLIADIARQGSLRDVFHCRQRLAGADALSGSADDRRRWVEIVERDERRPDLLAEMRDRADRHHLVIRALYI